MRRRRYADPRADGVVEMGAERMKECFFPSGPGTARDDCRNTHRQSVAAFWTPKECDSDLSGLLCLPEQGPTSGPTDGVWHEREGDFQPDVCGCLLRVVSMRSEELFQRALQKYKSVKQIL